MSWPGVKKLLESAATTTREARSRVARRLAKARAVAAEWFAQLGQKARTSPAAAVSPWLGTMVASWLVGWAQGNLWMIIAGAVIAAAGCSPVAASSFANAREMSRELRREARERQALTLASSVLLLPLADVPAMSIDRRVAARDAAADRTVKYLTENVFTDEGVRVVVFVVDDAGERMEPRWSAGRSDPPSAFVRGTSRGDAAFAEITGVSGHIYSNELEGRQYTAFISAPIVAGENAFGMLTVDATDADSLDSDDGYAVEVVASGLAVYFAEAIRGRRR